MTFPTLAFRIRQERKNRTVRQRFTGRETCRRLVEARTLRMLRYVEGGRSRASYNFDSRHKGKRNSLIPSNRITKNECKMEEGRASEWPQDSVEGEKVNLLWKVDSFLSNHQGFKKFRCHAVVPVLFHFNLLSTVFSTHLNAAVFPARITRTSPLL